MKIAWVCDYCNWLTISDSKEHHKMDICPCGKTGVDLEEYICRYMTNDPNKLRIIAKLDKGTKWKHVRGERK